MIARHNLKQATLAVISVLLGVFGFIAAFYFFRFAFWFVTYAFGFGAAGSYAALFGCAMLVIIAISGFVRRKGDQSFYGYADSSLFVNLDPVSGGAVAVDRSVHRITGPAYLLTQIFLMGPLQLFAAYDRMRSIITPNDALERSLAEVLAQIEAKRKWEGIGDYPGQEREIALLVLMGKLDFSRSKMRFRAKSCGSYADP